MKLPKLRNSCTVQSLANGWSVLQVQFFVLGLECVCFITSFNTSLLRFVYAILRFLVVRPVILPPSNFDPGVKNITCARRLARILAPNHLQLCRRSLEVLVCYCSCRSLRRRKCQWMFWRLRKNLVRIAYIHLHQPIIETTRCHSHFLVSLPSLVGVCLRLLEGCELFLVVADRGFLL